MSHTPGRFVWFEHLSNDIPKARAFYEKLFDWNAETMPMAGTDPYVMIHNGEAPIGGYAQAPAGSPPQWMSYLSVSDVDSTYKAALAAGAKSLVAPKDYGSAGRTATVADPTGGVFSLWRGTQGDPPEVETTPPGGFLWNELATKDEKMAIAFYEKVFDFTHDEMPMPEGAYFVLKQGERGPRRPVQGDARVDADDRGRPTSASPTATRPPSRPSRSAPPRSCRRATFPTSAAWRCSSTRRARCSRS